MVCAKPAVLHHLAGDHAVFRGAAAHPCADRHVQKEAASESARCPVNGLPVAEPWRALLRRARGSVSGFTRQLFARTECGFCRHPAEHSCAATGCLRFGAGLLPWCVRRRAAPKTALQRRERQNGDPKNTLTALLAQAGIAPQAARRTADTGAICPAGQ